MELHAPRLRIDAIDTPEAMSQFAGLLDVAFEVPAGHRFLDDFPVWDGARGVQAPNGVRVGVFEDDALVACAGVRLAWQRARAPGERKVALIGAVATAERMRGNGLASRLVQVCLEWAESHAAEVALLWGPLEGMYEELGFQGLGEQKLIALDALTLPSPAPTVGRGFTDGVWKALQRRTGGLQLEPEDLTWYREHRNVQWRWTGPPEAPDAYLAYGRGIDLPGIVHEWGGDSRALSALFAHARAETPGLQLLAPTQGFEKVPGAVQALCLAKALGSAALPPAGYPEFWIWGLDAC